MRDARHFLAAALFHPSAHIDPTRFLVEGLAGPSSQSLLSSQREVFTLRSLSPYFFSTIQSDFPPLGGGVLSFLSSAIHPLFVFFISARGLLTIGLGETSLFSLVFSGPMPLISVQVMQAKSSFPPFGSAHYIRGPHPAEFGVSLVAMNCSLVAAYFLFCLPRCSL